MNQRQLLKFCAYSLGIIVLWYFPADVQSTESTLAEMSNPGYSQCSDILQNLEGADVVYLGETHDSLEDHRAQLEIIRQLDRKNGKVAIALEMFQRPFQSTIDDYLAGKLTESQLVERTEYRQRWGFPREYYAPILRFAKEKQLPVLALNTPTKISRKVARNGLESLTPEEKQWIPPISEIRTDNTEYRQMLLEVFQQHQTSGDGNSDRLERFFLAQVLWDETMAETISQFIAARPNYQVVVLAGKGHVVYGYGIPSRVSRRINDRPLVQRSVLLNLSGNFSLPTDKPIADYIWKTTDAADRC